MTRARSPRYPSVSLEDAIQKVGIVFDSDRQNPIDRETAAIHLGYKSLSGASDKALSNLMQYGLLERIGKGELRVSDLAKDILHPFPEETLPAALLKAAYAPTLFSDLRDRFDQSPSPEALKSYLKREGFVDRAIGPITSAYLDTCLFIEKAGACDLSIPSPDEDAESPYTRMEEIPMQAVKTREHTPATSSVPQAALPTASPIELVSHKADVFNLSGGGRVMLTLPDTLTSDEYEDLSDWLDLMARRAKRRIRNDAETNDNPETNAD